MFMTLGTISMVMVMMAMVSSVAELGIWKGESVLWINCKDTNTQQWNNPLEPTQHFDAESMMERNRDSYESQSCYLDEDLTGFV